MLHANRACARRGREKRVREGGGGGGGGGASEIRESLDCCILIGVRFALTSVDIGHERANRGLIICRHCSSQKPTQDSFMKHQIFSHSKQHDSEVWLCGPTWPADGSLHCSEAQADRQPGYNNNKDEAQWLLLLPQTFSLNVPFC